MPDSAIGTESAVAPVMRNEESAPRVRSSKTRDARYYHACQSLVSRWLDAIRKHTPLHDTHTAISEWIRGLDVTITQRGSLTDKHWALRDFAVASGARWQLYLDGRPCTFDESAAVAHIAETEASPLGKGAAHDAYLGVMRRICGRHEWHESNDPFYADEAPALLNSTTKES